MPELLELGVVVLRNESRENFFIDVSLIIGEDTERLGTITPFPIDGSGTFMFKVDQSLAGSKREVNLERIKLRLTLEQERMDREIVVTIKSLRWLLDEDL